MGCEFSTFQYFSSSRSMKQITLHDDFTAFSRGEELDLGKQNMRKKVWNVLKDTNQSQRLSIVSEGAEQALRDSVEHVSAPEMSVWCSPHGQSGLITALQLHRIKAAVDWSFVSRCRSVCWVQISFLKAQGEVPRAAPGATSSAP